MRIVALLDSFWGDTPGQAPRFFRINPRNLSGRRLYRIAGPHRLIVTDSCREVQCSANHHGKPDPEWTRENLERLNALGFDLLLICGKVAADTYQAAGCNYPAVLYMDHPAARRWSNQKLEETAALVAAMLHKP
jgi:hypothetical protein